MSATSSKPTSPAGGASPSSPNAPKKTTVRVGNLALTSTTESVRDYFSFCGEIKTLQLCPSKSTSEATGRVEIDAMEALIEFDSESGATTACLITGAIVEERPIRVELADSSSSPSASRSSPFPKKLTSEAIVSEGKHIASEVSKKMSSVDEQYGISEGVKKAYVASAAKVKQVDEQLMISQRAAELAAAAKDQAKRVNETYGISERISGLGKSVSSFFTGGAAKAGTDAAPQ